MELKKYNLKNWQDLLMEDWDYLRQDYGAGNVENIIERLLQAQIKQIKKEAEKYLCYDIREFIKYLEELEKKI